MSRLRARLRRNIGGADFPFCWVFQGLWGGICVGPAHRGSMRFAVSCFMRYTVVGAASETCAKRSAPWHPDPQPD